MAGIESPNGRLPAAVAPSVMREMNQRLLLDHLFCHGAATRPQLARDCGLSLPTVIAALADLEHAGLVRTTERHDSAPQGRPAAAYEANPSCGYVVGVDIGHEWLRLVITDLAGTRLGQGQVRNTARSARALVDRTTTAVAALADETGIGIAGVTHTVIGSPGVYDTRQNRIHYAANLPGWHSIGLAQALRDKLGTPLTIDNDANLAALGEHIYGRAQNIRDFVYLTVGTGVGLGLILDGKLYRGATGAAGEAGYIPIAGRIPNRRRGAAARGILEEALAADAVVAEARDTGMTEVKNAEHVFSAARKGNQRALKAVAAEAERLAHLVATIGALFDPAMIVFGGGVGQNLDLLEPDLQMALDRLTPIKPVLAAGVLGNDAVVMGAVATGITIARESIFTRQVLGADNDRAGDG